MYQLSRTLLVMEKIGPFLVLVILATCSDGVFGFGNLVHKYDDYVHPGRTTTSKYGNVFYPKGTTTYKFDHDLYPEGTQTYKFDNAVISEPVKDGHTEKKTRKTAANTYDNGLYPERTTTFRSEHVVSSGQTSANTYDDGVYPGRTATSNSDHVVSSGQTSANTYDDGVYLERKTTSNSDLVVSSGQTTAKTYDVGLYPERTTNSNSDHVVSSEQTAAKTYGDGLYPEPTTTSNSDHGDYSGETAAYTYDDGLYSERSAKSNSDHVVSSGQTAPYTYEDGLYAERTIASNFNKEVFSKDSVFYGYDQRVYPVSSTRFKYDHPGVNPKRTETYKYANQENISTSKYSNGLNPDRVVTSNFYHGVYKQGTTSSSNSNSVNAIRTTASKYDHDVYPDGTTTASKYDHDVYPDSTTTASKYDHDVYPDGTTTTSKYDHDVYLHGSTTASKYDHDVYLNGTTTASKYDHDVYPDGTTTAIKYDHDVYPDGTTTASKYDHDVYPDSTTTASKYDHNVYPDDTTTASKYYHDMYPDGTTTASKYGHDVYPDDTTTASKYDHDVYPDGTTTASKYDHDVYPDGITTASKYDHDVYPDDTTTASMYDHDVYPDGSTTASKYDHDVYPDGSTTASKYDHDVYPDSTTTASKYDHDVYPDGTTKTSKYDHDVYPDGTTTYIYDYEASEDIHQQGQSRQTTKNKYALGMHLTRNKRFMADYGVYPEQITMSIFDNSVLPELTTRYKYDYSLYHKGTRTSKYGFSVYPEGTTEHLYDNGVTTEPDISVNPEEKIVIGGQMTCDIINITNTVSPFDGGTAYHVEKSSRMFWVWFYEFRYILVTLSNSCANLMPEPLRRFTGRDLQDLLQDCKNGTVIQKLLCNPSVTYNISLVNDMIPYFSDVGIFFADGINCTELFNKFIESEKSILSNAHVNYFLTYRSNCWDYAYFTNQIIIDIKLYEIRNGSSSIIYGNLYTPHMATEQIVFILKHQSCRELFYQYAYLKVKMFDDRAILSIDNINAFTHEHNCLDVRFPCQFPLYDMDIVLPDSTIVYVQMVMSVEVTLVNSVFLFIFLQKENRTPVTILLSFLAVSDTITVLLMTLLLFIFYERSSVLFLEFPECVIYTFTSDLLPIIHLTSVLITALLCLQKTVALLFPMWSKRSMNIRVCFIFSFFAFFISVCINSPKLVENLLSIKHFNGRCCTFFYDDLSEYHLIMHNVFYLVSCLVVTICTVYIICKLTCLRRNLPWTDSPVVQKRNRISAITVLSICIIFLLSESVVFVQYFMYMLDHFDSSYFNILIEIDSALRPYTNIILIFGFSLNFIVYIIMSKQLRDTLVIRVIRIVRCCKCW